MITEIHPDTDWTLEKAAALPYREGTHYELIDGELHITSDFHLLHQSIMGEVMFRLFMWNKQTRPGKVIFRPGVLFSERDIVAPDVVWFRRERCAALCHADGRLHGAPDLMVEILSRGQVNTRRDRVLKLAQYDRFGVGEYWIVDRFARTVEVYRRDADERLTLAQTLGADATLASPLLPGFACIVGSLFADE
jgi:Uma2 family endonuclease